MVVIIALAVFGVLRRKHSQRISYTKEAKAFPAKRGLGLEDAMKVVEVVPMKDVGGRLRDEERAVGFERRRRVLLGAKDNSWG